MDAIAVYFSLLFHNAASIIITLVIIGAVLGFVIYRSKHQGKITQSGVVGSKEANVTFAVIEDGTVEVAAKKVLLGTGKYRCMAYRLHPQWGPSVDFTTMPEPVGDMVIAETSLPMSGSIYEVVELLDGSLVPYNEARQMPIIDEETPEFAWICTHWESARRFWTVPKAWWKSMSNWYAAGMLCIVFIVVLVVTGGGK